VPYSTRRYIPDFTFNRIGLAAEVKLCKAKDREKQMIEEIIGCRARAPARARRRTGSLPPRR